MELYYKFVCFNWVCKDTVSWLSMRAGCPSDGLLAVDQKKKVFGKVKIAFFKYPDVIQSLNKCIKSKSVTELIQIYRFLPKLLSFNSERLQNSSFVVKSRL